MSPPDLGGYPMPVAQGQAPGNYPAGAYPAGSQQLGMPVPFLWTSLTLGSPPCQQSGPNCGPSLCSAANPSYSKAVPAKFPTFLLLYRGSSIVVAMRVLFVTTPNRTFEPECSPAPKNKHASGAAILRSMLQKRSEEQQFHLYLTWAFTTCNIPAEELSQEALRAFCKKCLPNYPLVHPINYGGTWLLKVAGAKRTQLEAIIIRTGEHYSIIFVDETTDHHRPLEEYQLSVKIVLQQKGFNQSDSAGVHAFHFRFERCRNGVTTLQLAQLISLPSLCMVLGMRCGWTGWGAFGIPVPLHKHRRF